MPVDVESYLLTQIAATRGSVCVQNVCLRFYTCMWQLGEGHEQRVIDAAVSRQWCTRLRVRVKVSRQTF